MKRRNVIISVVVVAVIAIMFIALKVIKKEEGKRNIERNYGIAHTETNITSNGVETTKPEDAVPQKDQLLQNLKDKGYHIEYYNTVFDSEISCYRILATKDNAFIDICYDLADDNAEKAFYEYENKYNKYYLMAMNGTYVYCISDKEVFKDAGFKSLANNGIQYIND
ncbi:MAG TPA: hypothetical protein GX501_07560 [Clostridiaceae bacterium]|nr:hypothetical protein [Clostridiaceae bacterium]